MDTVPGNLCEQLLVGREEVQDVHLTRPHQGHGLAVGGGGLGATPGLVAVEHERQGLYLPRPTVPPIGHSVGDVPKADHLNLCLYTQDTASPEHFQPLTGCLLSVRSDQWSPE